MKKAILGFFFKKPPDDYLFESMIIFCIFFWAIPIFYFPRDIKFDLTSVPAQCELLCVVHNLLPGVNVISGGTKSRQLGARA